MMRLQFIMMSDVWDCSLCVAPHLPTTREMQWITSSSAPSSTVLLTYLELNCRCQDSSGRALMFSLVLVVLVGKHSHWCYASWYCDGENNMAGFEGIPFLNMKCIFNVWSEFGMNQERSPRIFPKSVKVDRIIVGYTLKRKQMLKTWKIRFNSEILLTFLQTIWQAWRHSW